MNKAIIAHEVDGLKGRVLVDGFRHQKPSIEAYFLTHFHGDHYDGLSETFDGPGLIHCTSVTARLVIQQLGVRTDLVKSYEYEETATVCGANVTFLDANHCPGAALLLFELQCGAMHLHTGDMRYSPRMKDYPALKSVRGKLDHIYLDTTYCHPKHTFQSQEDSVAFIADSVAAAVKGKLGNDEPGENAGQGQGETEDQFGSTVGRFDGGTSWPCLVMLSAYKIGKERVLLEVARRSGCQIYVDEAKIHVLRCLGLAEAEMALFTTDMHATPIHVCRMGFAGELWPFFRPNFTNLQRYVAERRLEVHSCRAFIPTGWADGSNYNKRNALQRKGVFSVQCVPYSEHSNYNELIEFVSFLKPKRVIPTVFSDEKTYRAIVARFASKVDANANKRAFVSFMSRGASTASAAASPRPGGIKSEAAGQAADCVEAKSEVKEEAVGERECIEVLSDGGEEGACSRADGGGSRDGRPTRGDGRGGAGPTGGREADKAGEERGGREGTKRRRATRRGFAAHASESKGEREEKRRRGGEGAEEEVVVDLCSDAEAAEALPAAPSPAAASGHPAELPKKTEGMEQGRRRGHAGEIPASTASQPDKQTSLRSFFSPMAKARDKQCSR